LGIGLSHRLNERLTAGANVGWLSEQHSILGNSYGANTAFNFGDRNHTTSVGFSAAYRFDDNNALLTEVSYATTRGGNASGLIADTSEIKSRSWGMTFTSKNLIGKGDDLTVVIVKPLSVTSGQVAVWVPQVDAHGASTLGKAWVSLTPSGSETDVCFTYDAPLRGGQSLAIQANYRKDMQNLSGNNEAAVGLAWKAKF
jgi:hypothetical protein